VNIPEIIRDYCVKYNTTRTGLAQDLSEALAPWKVSKQNISRWENGLGHPDRLRLMRLVEHGNERVQAFALACLEAMDKTVEQQAPPLGG
jgi:hypothetical protein